jgi:Bacterial Ig domain
MGRKHEKLLKRGSILIAAAAMSAALLTGCGHSNDFVITNTNGIVVVQGPVANNDTITALGNATLNQETANSVLSNDTVNGAQISAFDATTTQGGTVNLNPDGSFTYTPVFGFTGNDTFTYTLSNSAGDSTATVTLNVNNSGFFVDNSGANGNGSQATPFNNLPDALAAAGNGDTIFVYFGDGSNTNQDGAFTLPLGVNLVGQGAGLVVAQTIEPVGSAPFIQGPITAMGNNTISGFVIDSELTGDGIIGNGASNLTVSQNTFRNVDGDSYLNLDDVGGTVTISNNTFESMSGDGDFIRVDNTGVDVAFSLLGNIFTQDSNDDADEALDFNLSGASTCTLVANNNSFSSTSVTGLPIEDCIEVDVNDSSTLAVTIDQNTFNNIGSPIDLDANGNSATLTGTVSGNMITNTDSSISGGGNGIESDAFGGTVSLTITGNTLDNCDGGAIDVDADDTGGDMTVVVTGNTVTDTTGDNAFELEIVDGATGTAAIRNNSFTNSNTFSVAVFGANTSSGCLDITGNTVDDDMSFDAGAGGTLDIERFSVGTGGPLTSVNTFTGAAVQQSGTITPRAAGFCAIP